jgi:hypothetical protein
MAVKSVTKYEAPSETESGAHRVEVTPSGREKQEVRAAASRAFHGDTSEVRSAMVAAGVSDVNPNHPHASTYTERAEEMTVERTIVEKNGVEYTVVTIEVDQ